jgi:hypothetical protein
MVKSRFTGKEYEPSKTIRILNALQAAAYIKYGIVLLDLWLSKNKEGKPILVYIFDREESTEAYDLWCKHEL